MFVVVVFFILSGLLFYPITLMTKVEDGALRLYWLPHLFASEAQPVEIKIHKRQKKKKGKKHWRQKLRLLLNILGATHLEKLWFRWLLFSPGKSSFNAECIISVTVCDIIGRVLRRIWRKRWRR